jgi:nucleoside-diphosphate-sugar epimerase
MYIDDLIEGLWRLLNSSHVGPVNIGNPDEMALRSMAEKIIEITGSNSPIELRPLPMDDPKVRRPDISLAQRVLGGWKPEVSIEDGLSKTHDYFLEAVGRTATTTT